MGTVKKGEKERMFCTKCGKEIHDEAIVCPFCGCSPKGNGDAPNIGYAIVGFLLPLLGLVLFLINKKEYPKRARSAGLGALIALIPRMLIVLLYVFAFSTLFW